MTFQKFLIRDGFFSLLKLFLFFRFSGIKAEDLEGVTTTIREVQAVLLSMFSAKTILIGHSLESDLKALKVTKVNNFYPKGFC
jgi:hypothetical protein